MSVLAWLRSRREAAERRRSPKQRWRLDITLGAILLSSGALQLLGLGYVAYLFWTLHGKGIRFTINGWLQWLLVFDFVVYPVVSVLMAIGGARGLRNGLRLRHRFGHGLCLGCGYDLRVHGVGQLCPECGRLIEERDRPRQNEDVRRL